jgi:large subunit ribosomal protein L6
MSRIGSQPIQVPDGVQVDIKGPRMVVKGPLGEADHTVPEDLLTLAFDADRNCLVVNRKMENRQARRQHGLHRSLVANKVEGVSKGFQKRLEVHGTGYGANMRGDTLVLQIGFCHEVEFDMPEGITVEIEQAMSQIDNPARFVLKGADKEQVGQLAATIRAVRPPEPYKGKGIRYEGEYVRRKEGKAFTGME